MYKLRVVQSGKQYDYEPGASLLEILLAQNIFIDNPCNGKYRGFRRHAWRAAS